MVPMLPEYMQAADQTILTILTRLPPMQYAQQIPATAQREGIRVTPIIAASMGLSIVLRMDMNAGIHRLPALPRGRREEGQRVVVVTRIIIPKLKWTGMLEQMPINITFNTDEAAHLPGQQ